MSETQEEQRVEQLLAPLRWLEPAGLPPRGRPRRRARGVLALAVPLALVALFVALRPGGDDGSASNEVVEAARAALATPPGAILHTVVAFEHPKPGCPSSGETWQDTSPPYAALTRYGGARAIELGLVGRTVELYDARTDMIYRWHQAVAPAQHVIDPVSYVRSLLADGAKIAGHETLGGRPVIVLRTSIARIYVDATTYQTLKVVGPGGTTRVKVHELLPASRANLRRLSVEASHPSARVVDAPAGKAVTAPASC